MTSTNYGIVRPLLVQALARLYGVNCVRCGQPIDLTLPPRTSGSASLDHVTAVAEGGTHDLDNIRLAHLGCNSVNGARLGAARDQAVRASLRQRRPRYRPPNPADPRLF
jgi:5-methylcytosine-specific restriction endonuclease McrA